MKLLYFDDYKLGVLKGERVVDVSSVVRDIPHTGPGDLINGLIARFDQYRGQLEDAAASGQGVAAVIGQGAPAAAQARPTSTAMAVNYMEDGTRSAPAPINAFHKSPSAICGPGDTMVLPDVPATIFEGEAELARRHRQAREPRQSRRRDGLRLRLHQLHRRLGARSAAGGQCLLSDEVARHLCADRPLSGDQGRNPGSETNCRSGCGTTAP